MNRRRDDPIRYWNLPQPYKCPKCDGVGMLKYNPLNPFGGSSTSAGPWQCPACNGSGILR